MIDNATYEAICNDFFPVFKKLAATDVYSITLGGSHGKGLSDQNSDFDFRIYYEEPSAPEIRKPAFDEINQLCTKWKAKNISVDGIFPRTYAEVDAQLDLWLSGKGNLTPCVWTVWGYSILTDIYNQKIIEDPHGKAAQWKQRLAAYPDALKQAIVDQYSRSIQYWRSDYHYLNKVNRRDIVFCASIAARLVHNIIQIIYALNEFYYPGDGMNLEYTRQFAIKPCNFEERVGGILYASMSDNGLKLQYENIMALIDDTVLLVNRHRNQRS